MVNLIAQDLSIIHKWKHFTEKNGVDECSSIVIFTISCLISYWVRSLLLIYLHIWSFYHLLSCVLVFQINSECIRRYTWVLKIIGKDRKWEQKNEVLCTCLGNHSIHVNGLCKLLVAFVNRCLVTATSCIQTM